MSLKMMATAKITVLFLVPCSGWLMAQEGAWRAAPQKAEVRKLIGADLALVKSIELSGSTLSMNSTLPVRTVGDGYQANRELYCVLHHEPLSEKKTIDKDTHFRIVEADGDFRHCRLGLKQDNQIYTLKCYVRSVVDFRTSGTLEVFHGPRVADLSPLFVTTIRNLPSPQP